MSGTGATLQGRARAIIEAYAAKHLTIVTAESCTGGLIAAALTDIDGSSAVFDRGFVTYSNAAKMTMLGVTKDALATQGAVSKTVAIEMAEGARRVSGADAAVSVTGIAGHGGGTANKPVGLVHFACASASGTAHLERRFGDLGRSAVRRKSVAVALELLMEAIDAG